MLCVALHCLAWWLGSRCNLDSYFEYSACDFDSDFLNHCIELVEAVDFVFCKRVVLAIATQVYSLTQAVQIFELIKPFSVDCLNILVSDKHIELLVSDKSFFFGDVILQE